jgi:DNA-directed RNA polymerase specialized sigma24 family protein
MNADDARSTGHELVRLTRRRRNGDVLVRNTAVDAEIRSMLGLSAVEIRRRALIQRDDVAGFISAECLVYMVRDARRRNDDGMLRAVWDAITARVSPYVESKLRTLDDTYHEEGVAAVIRKMAFAILDLDSDHGDFFQVSFWTTIQRRTIDEFRRQVSLAKQDRKFTSLNTLPGEEGHSSDLEDEGDSVSTEHWASQSTTVLEEFAQQELEVQNSIRIEVALSTLPELVRKAFVLRVEGWPVESNDPNDTTISTMLQRTPRQIRNYLKEAKERLSKWREEDQ